MNYRAFWYLIPNQVIRSKSMFVFTNKRKSTLIPNKQTIFFVVLCLFYIFFVFFCFIYIQMNEKIYIQTKQNA